MNPPADKSGPERAVLRIGTRGSPLALAQANETKARLLAAHADLDASGIEIVVIKTSGDRIQDRPLAEAGGKGLFTKEIEEALLDRRIDLAVHSMKDVPTVLPDGLVMAAFLPREDPRDALIGAASIAALPEGAVIGTASLRRQAILLHKRPDLRIVSLRGNVQTRLAKLREGQVQATLLALAGLRRLGLEREITGIIEPEEMLPAVAQGAIGIECRADDEPTRTRLYALNDPTTEVRVSAERALLAALDGSCRTPIAALAILTGDALHLRALIVTPDGRRAEATVRDGAVADAARLGLDAGAELKRRGGPDFFA
jgi:hydroxymethylbilane synthase